MANKTISNLSGGMNVKTNPLIIRDSECELVVNYNLDTVGSLTKRNGYDVFASQPVAGKQILGLAQYTNTSSSAETTQVMVVNNSGATQAVIYYNNSGTWATSKTNDTAVSTVTNFNRSRFVTFIDYLFRVNGVDATATSNNVNGSSWGTTNAPATITPSFIAVFQDRVYVARNGTSAASTVYFSSLPSSGAITWDTTNDTFTVNPDDGDEITALENNGNRLLIFKNRALYRWTFGITEPDRLIGVGTESQESVKTNLDLGITFFANSKGIYAYTGERPRLISRKIQPWIEAVPAASWNDVAAEVDDDHYYCYLSDSLTVSGVTYTNVMAVYTVSMDAWTIYSLHKPWRVASRLIQSNAENIYFGSSNGRTYKWSSGLTDDSGGANGDTAVPVSGDVITKEHLLTFPDKTFIMNVSFMSDLGFTTRILYQLDRTGDFQSLAQLTKRYTTSPRINHIAHSIRLRFTDNTAVASRIDGYNIEHDPQNERK